MEQRKGQCCDIASVGFSVATLCGESLETMAMSQHQLKKEKQRDNNVMTYEQLQQSNYGSHPMSRHHNNMATTLLVEEKIESFECRDIKSEMLRH